MGSEQSCTWFIPWESFYCCSMTCGKKDCGMTCGEGSHSIKERREAYEDYLKMTDNDLFSCIDLGNDYYCIKVYFTKNIYVQRQNFYKEKKFKICEVLSKLVVQDYLPSNAKETYMERIKNIALQKGWVIY